MTKNTNERWWLHHQNLSAEKRPGALPLHGRAWLHFGDRTVLHVEWNALSRSCGVRFAAERSSDEAFSGHVALPPLAFYWGVDLGRRIAQRLLEGPSDMGAHCYGREIRIAVHDWALWWSLWTDVGGWSSKRPRWRDGSLHFLDVLFGKAVHSSRALEAEEILVPMPEGTYAGTCRLTEDTWKRPRWFARRLKRAHVEMADPVPVPGKGENSWDCGDDALFGSTFPAASVAEAIAGVVRSALETRRRYGGRGWKPEPAKASA